MGADVSAGTPAAAAITIDLWVWSLRQPANAVARLAQLLSDDECARAARFLSPQNGDGYIAGRGRLREILADYLALLPSQLVFGYGAAGKPFLDGVRDAPAFNLSHSGDWAVLAVTAARRPIGIDIETIRPLKEDIAGRFFAASEAAALAALPPDLQTAAFFRCWTRKEAFIKAKGDGLGYSLQAFEVSLLENEPAVVKSIAGQTPHQVADWRLHHFEPAPGLVGAIAIDTGSPDASVVVRRRA